MPLRNMTYKDLKDIANLYTSANPFSNEEDVLKWTKRGLKNILLLTLFMK